MSIITLGLILFYLQLIQVTQAVNKTVCPLRCHCFWSKGNIDCSDTDMYDLSLDIPAETVYLNLSNNLLGSNLKEIKAINEFNTSQDSNNASHFTSSLKAVLLKATNLSSLDLDNNNVHKSPLGVLHYSSSLRHLFLADNNISQVIEGKSDTNQSSHLELLDLSRNHVSNLPTEMFVYFSHLNRLWADNNVIQAIAVNFSLSQIKHNIQFISLAHNLIDYIDPITFHHFHNLEVLDLSNNKLTDIEGIWFKYCSHLLDLSLAGNPISYIPNSSFGSCKNLSKLNLSGLKYLVALNSKSFYGLNKLNYLNLSDSVLKVIHPDTFSFLDQLQILDISNNALKILYNNTLQEKNLTVYLDNNPWICNCDVKWLSNWLKTYSSQSNTKPVCATPYNVTGLSLTDIPTESFDCEGAEIINNTQSAYLKLGSSLMLDCIVSGSPMPIIQWITPKKQVFQFHPAGTEYSPIKPESLVYHSGHHWHTDRIYDQEQQSQNDQRIHVLQNGSLFIDYILRIDPGHYTCFTYNKYGNQSVDIIVTLNYLSFIENTKWSILTGLFCAGIFLFFGMGVGLIRIISTQCSRSEKEKRKGIAQVLQNLNEYRTAKVGQFTAYKSAKLDQLSAFRNAKVGKLRTYKQATLQSVLQHMQTLREHYTSQIARVKDNCSQQVEKLRENYSTQAGKFKMYKSSKVGRLKGYKSGKVDKLKEHYNNQALKIREYGSQQMTKLREQYKLQQQHLLKLLELLDVGNCMSVIESECMRTDSMIFNDSLMHLDLDTNPAHIIINLSDSESADSEYITASSHSDISNSGNHSIVNIRDNIVQTASSNINRKRKKRKKRKCKRVHRNAHEGCGLDTNLATSNISNSLCINAKENVTTLMKEDIHLHNTHLLASTELDLTSKHQNHLDIQCSVDSDESQPTIYESAENLKEDLSNGSPNLAYHSPLNSPNVSCSSSSSPTHCDVQVINAQVLSSDG